MKLKISKKSIIIASIIVAVAGAGLIYYLSTKQSGDVKAWADSNWIYRKSLQVENTGSTVTNEDVLVTVDTATLVTNSKLQPDCDDLRFVDSDDSTYLDYWIEDGCNTTSTKIWVRIPTLNSGGETIYMYYGNSSATSAQETWSGNVMMYADTTCPSGWTQASELDNKFLYGSSTYGSTGGSDTHSHSNAVCTSDSISTTDISGTIGAPVYKVHTFTSSGTFVASENLNVEVLVVAGGGGGGQEVGGGGGGGGVVYNSSYSVSSGSVPVTVGNGGAGVSTSVRAGNGGNSVFGSITSIGGGGGGDNDQYSGGNGGSGGGGGCSTTGGSGTSGQGTSGSNGSYGSWPDLGAGGGGGAVNPGQPAFTYRAGDGGAGYYSAISGTGTYYGGGGGGGSGFVVPGGTGGLGGGGNGTGSTQTAGTNGAPNTGGGGGGGGGGSSFTSASGGSGIVIVRYASSTAKATGGTITTLNYNYPSISTSHTHNNLTSSISSISSLPPYKNMVLCYNNKFTLTSGLISLFSATVPSDWTRFTALDNIFPRVSSSYGTTGGSSTHTHTTSGTTTASTEETIKTAIPLVTAGGTKTTSGAYTIHTFTAGSYRSNSSFYTSAPLNVEVLVVAGGGAGGQELGGGGGGGGVRYSSSYNLSAGSTPVIVGIGGRPQNSYTGTANKGENSVFGSLTAIGGGGGGSASAGATGGSGGGGGTRTGNQYPPGSGTSGQGYSGGYGSGGGWPASGAGGGGGAGATGVNGTNSKAGDGGVGYYSTISGTGAYYGGGGGGGGGTSTTIGYGGAGGGGNGNNAIGSPGTAGAANTGGGGGGGGSSGSYYNAGGGSGIVIVRYLTPTKTIASATHTHTTSNTSTSADNNIPPYITAIFGKANSSVYANENNILMTSSVPPLGWNRFTAFDNKFVMGSSSYGTTGGASTHTHTITNTTGGPSGTTTVATTGSSNFADSSHTHSCSVSSNSVSNLPAYSSVIYMQRKVSKTVIIGIEEMDNVAPNTPSSLLTEGQANPTGITDLTPEFSAVYTDNDTSDTATYYQILVNSSSDFTGTSIWDSTKTAFGTPIVNGNRSSDISYAGSALENGTTYFWKIKFWDEGSLDSSWSSTAQFSTNYIPNQPSSLLTEGQTNPTKTTLSPYFSAIFTDNDTSDTATYYQILVNSSSDFTGTSMWDSTKTAFGTPIVNGNRSSDISYAGSALENGTTYFWKIKFWDNNDLEGTYSETATFTTTGVPSAPKGLQTNGQTNPTIVNDYTPYFSAIYSDINGDNASYYEIEINTNSSFTGTVIWDTDKTSTNITSGSRSPNYESASLGNIETTYYWRIRFWDTDDNVSEWSSTASFTTSSTHFRFEGLKMEGIKLN